MNVTAAFIIIALLIVAILLFMNFFIREIINNIPFYIIILQHLIIAIGMCTLVVIFIKFFGLK